MSSLEELRKQAGFERREAAAERLGIHRDQLGRYERGVNTPRPEILMRMSEVYGCNLAEVYTALTGREERAV